MNFSSGSERVTEQPSTNLLLQFDGNSAQNPEPNTWTILSTAEAMNLAIWLHQSMKGLSIKGKIVSLNSIMIFRMCRRVWVCVCLFVSIWSICVWLYVRVLCICENMRLPIEGKNVFNSFMIFRVSVYVWVCVCLFVRMCSLYICVWMSYAFVYICVIVRDYVCIRGYGHVYALLRVYACVCALYMCVARLCDLDLQK